MEQGALIRDPGLIMGNTISDRMWKFFFRRLPCEVLATTTSEDGRPVEPGPKDRLPPTDPSDPATLDETHPGPMEPDYRRSYLEIVYWEPLNHPVPTYRPTFTIICEMPAADCLPLKGAVLPRRSILEIVYWVPWRRPVVVGGRPGCLPGVSRMLQLEAASSGAAAVAGCCGLIFEWPSLRVRPDKSENLG
ncbi:unnamed protein product [Bursaphelenchus xylophilus]|uniref:(pine wood nematode) hypothetical protein n=1 Tax=Bursaphelenchus xylophilus TaxID=6326 RepID=A0A1I7RI41_BURXY|nr:unnamed protein product [Bursaphelenchus xylophilus]CAG9115171.1 unnamed protein product [Bursaphelenchus xylophilus]